MGSQVTKMLQTIDDVAERDVHENQSDIEHGVSSHTSDSSLDSSDNDDLPSLDKNSSICLDEEDFVIAPSSNDPYIVERRMTAGSNTWTYEIKKRN